MDWANFGIDLHVELDRSAGRRAGLERALREAIRDGRLATDARLPASRTLAAQLGLSRGTVSAAYDQLIAEGYLTAVPGSATRVARLTGVTPLSAEPGATAPPDGAFRYDLRPGSPDVTSFPTDAWLRATRRALAAAPATAYGYGDPRGTVELRTALAGYLGRARGVLATPGRILVTSGSVQALALLAEVLRDEAGQHTAIAMENPGLAFHREVVLRRGVPVLPLPVDGCGARTDLLSTAGYAGVRAVLVTPAHQYPTGVTLHPDRRHALADWARATGGLVIEDDYDGEFRYDRQPVGAVQQLAPEHTVYLGTAAKTLAPGLRLAWMVPPERLVEPLAEAKRHADAQTEVIGQLTLADLIGSHGYDRHVRACRLRYRRRRDLLVDRLGPPLPGRPAPRGVAAGLHALIDLPPSGRSEATVLAAAARQGLALAGLTSHWHPAGGDGPVRQPPGIIVGYGTPGTHRYPAAVDTLVRVLRSA
ncbi:PLP-dependent aminotransferase family protein [Plantactinospora sp. GCM10030261]|uniref:MocR-like pyridoxine biosynthesis transcription factor PdxR n=1 Tax=Plantactinospora sp. GCM10030261 TaxID=3273420 RepID=UPI003619A426